MADSLKQRITDAMKDAMRAKDSKRLTVIRLILAAVKQKEVDERITVDDTQLLAILDNMIKQRRGSIAEFEKANRQDLIDIEQYEIALIKEFLPEPLSAEEISQLVKSAIAQTGATTMQDMSKVMAILKPQLQGRADIGQVSGQIKQFLS